MFFIDDDKTQVVEGKEDGGTGTQKELVAVGTLLEGALPHFGTFARIETGMVDADSGSEEASEPIDDLGGERNFGEQEKHLLTARKDIVDETDIDFGFAAGGDAVKERHRLLGIGDELVSLLLFATQFDGEGRDGLRGGRVDKTAFFTLREDEDAFTDKRVEGGRRKGLIVGEHLFGDRLVSKRAELHEAKQDKELLVVGRLVFEGVEKLVLQGLVVDIVGCETDPGRSSWREALLEFLVKEHDAFLDHGLDKRHNLLVSGDLFNLVEGDAVATREDVEDARLVGRQRAAVAREIGMDDDERLAGETQRGRQSDGHNIARKAHVVGGHPFPEAELAFGDDRFEVENGEDVLGTVCGHLVVDASHEGRIESFGAELDHDTLPHTHRFLVFDGEPVGVSSWKVKRQKYVNKKHSEVRVFLCCFFSHHSSLSASTISQRNLSC